MPDYRTYFSSDFPTGLWMGTNAQESSTRSTFEVQDPATGSIIANVADASVEDAQRALDLAVAAQESWRVTSPRDRAAVLHAVSEALAERSEEFARTITLEMGKPLEQAHAEVANACEYFSWFAEEAVRIPGRFAYSPSGESQFKVSRLAVGPVLAITPWNFPLAMSARKIAPALAAGCPVIAKPAPDTPLILLLLGEVLAKVFPEHGVTDGLVSILPTSDAQALARTLMSDPRLRKITFTGSTPVGRQLVRQAAENLQRTSMELGGNAPFVVAEDADIDLAVASALQAKLRNCGQVCVAANRFLVDSSIAEEFVDKLLVGLRAVRLGNGLDPETTVGPLVSVAQRNRVADLVSEAIADGSILRCGGHCPEGPGAFYPPTVLVDVPATSRIIREEIFGPVFTVTTFDGIEEGVAVANSTEFGLASYGFSNSVSTARYLAEHLEAGMVGINRGTVSETAAPFGGIKQSGFGREGGIEGIEEYLDIRYVLS